MMLRVYPDWIPREPIEKRLVRLRKERGMSQGDWAVKAGVERNLIGMIEVGRAKPSINTLIRLAEGLDLDLGVMLTNCDLSAWKKGN